MILNFRIQELESRFSKDLSEDTFNELKELKKSKISINLTKLLMDFYIIELYKTSKFKLSWKELLQNHLLD